MVFDSNGNVIRDCSQGYTIDEAGNVRPNAKSNEGASEAEDYDDTYDDYYDDESPRREKVGNQKGNAPRDNQKQNEQTDKVAKELGLTKQQQQELHREIGNQGLGYKEILERAKELFGK